MSKNKNKPGSGNPILEKRLGSDDPMSKNKNQLGSGDHMLEKETGEWIPYVGKGD